MAAAMIYVFSAIFFVLGIAVGYKIQCRIFSLMANQGTLIFKSDGEWIGEPEAWQNLKEWLMKP
jgi:hypothetical protein